jgi:hypothetical protein
MKTLNFDIFGDYQLTNEEMMSVRGGDGPDPSQNPNPTIKV